MNGLSMRYTMIMINEWTEMVINEWAFQSMNVNWINVISMNRWIKAKNEWMNILNDWISIFPRKHNKDPGYIIVIILIKKKDGV